MKRVGNLYDSITDMDNLHLAFWKAGRGKRGKPDVIAFQENLDQELADLRDQLVGGDVHLGDYRFFTIHDPKERTICAAPFRERVLHHAIMNVCEPHFERYQIYDSYACRKGKGTTGALDRAEAFVRRFGWYLKLDVRKYFYTIDHSVLKVLLRRRFKDSRLLHLFDKIIDSYEVLPRKGLPIGNLTSQYFANHYLAVLDHFIKEELRIPGYVRYMDDMLLFSDDKGVLKTVSTDVRNFCEQQLQLELKPDCLNKTRFAVPFLGYRLSPNSICLSAAWKRRYRKNLKGHYHELLQGTLSQQDFAVRLMASAAYTNCVDGPRFRRRAMNDLGCRSQARTAHT